MLARTFFVCVEFGVEISVFAGFVWVVLIIIFLKKALHNRINLYNGGVSQCHI